MELLRLVPKKCFLKFVQCVLINFCFYCRLTARSRDSAESCITFYLSEIEKQGYGTNAQSALKNRALVVDGKTLTFILDLR